MSDRSAELQAALVETPPGGTYRLSGAWQVDYPVTVPPLVTIECVDATLWQSSDGTDLAFKEPPPRFFSLRARSFLKLLQGANLYGDLTLIGTNTESDYRVDLEAQHGLILRGGNTVEGSVKVQGVWGDGFYIRGDEVTVRGVVVSGSGRQGVGVTDGNGIVIEGCSWDRVGRSVIDIEPVNHEVVTNLTIRDCVVGSWGHGFSGGTGGQVVASLGNGGVDGVLFENLRCRRGLAVSVGNDAEDPTKVVRRSNYRFRNCISEKPRNKPVFNFRHIDGYEVTGCSAAFGSAKPGATAPAIRAVDCTGPTVEDNTFPGYSPELLEVP